LLGVKPLLKETKIIGDKLIVSDFTHQVHGVAKRYLSS
jgi:hypothetical protein